MSTHSNVMPGSSLESHAMTPVVISPMRRFVWSVRRELWENRSIYVAPLAVAAVLVFGFLIATSLGKRHASADTFTVAAVLIMATVTIVGLFYSLDALHSERRDRSILFWKSLPVSDLTTVLSKASIPLVVLPLFGFVLTLATQFIMLVLGSAVRLGTGQSVATLWSQVSFVQMSLVLLYHILTSHGLWYAPIYGWLLLVSAWSRRAPFLWAVMPPLAIGFAEKLAFNTSYFSAMLKSRLMGGPDGAFPSSGMSSGMPMASLAQLTPGQFLISPGLWIGLAIAATLIFAAVRLRRYQGPI
jgi:ABC-2 type transport system permease protein